MKPVVFLGSKKIGYQCLEHLLKNQQELGIEVVGVLTNNNTRFGAQWDLIRLAGEHQVPVLPGLEALLDMDIDFLVSVQYHEILKKQHIDRARVLAINLHMAPLPEYRGCNQFSFAIVNDEQEFGTTLHVMSEGIDSGDILFERRFPLEKGSQVSTLYDKTLEESLILFEEKAGSIFEGAYTRTPQEDLLGERSTSLHYRHEINTLKAIDPDWPADKIERHIRGTYMPGFAPPYMVIGGKKYELHLKED